jgi:UDP-glucose 4-epimerase
MHFIVTGGLGYIGAHTIIQLYKAGHTAVILDDCRNSEEKTAALLNQIVGVNVPFYKVDLTNKEQLFNCLLGKQKRTNLNCIIHFAALKNVGESVVQPFDYYHNNIIGLLNMLAVAKELNCPNFIFSSSCTVYPQNVPKPLTEKTRAAASNEVYETIVTGSSPYGTTKIMCEQILHDIAAADPFWKITVLRYFNPVGNHSSHLIGDNFVDKKKSMNLFTAILNKSLHREPVEIFGQDYATKDGTCIRDYIHVIDVADAHILAAEKAKQGLEVFNIGTGLGYSVLEIVNKFNECGLDVYYTMVNARKGDIAEVWADCTKAKNILKWEPKYSLDDMVQSTIDYYNYQVKIC